MFVTEPKTEQRRRPNRMPKVVETPPKPGPQPDPRLAAAMVLLMGCPPEELQRLSADFYFCKKLTTLEAYVPSQQFDLIYYDAFAPSAQPDLWTSAALGKMYDALLPGGVLVTYCAKGEVKRSLRALGFEVESLPGPPGKREMIRASRQL